MTALVERALAPLDVARGAVVRALAARPILLRVMATRARRVPALLSLHALAAFALAVVAPALPLALAPVFLGVPHVVADVRHLVVRRALPRWWVRSILAFAAALLAVRLLEEARVLRAAPVLVEHALGAAWILCGAVAGAIAGGARRSAALAILAAMLVGVAALAAPRGFRFAFVHGHNLVALALWVWLFRRRRALAWPVAALVALGAAVLASGALLPVTVHRGVLSVMGLHLFAAADWLAPGVPDRWALGLTTSFAFLQSVHYAVWLIAIPQDDARVDGTATFAMSWRSLRRDLGGRALWVGVVLAAAVPVAALFALSRTRMLFLSLGTFHAWMELALAAFFLARGGRTAAAARQSVAGP